ncbi:MAG: hypothetical protein ASARMPRED_009291 [Alectoria sarmentosa]|nr:MAG: hypothetical protein ASARMPRED_009291 [Alectoria sarmentosa]
MSNFTHISKPRFGKARSATSSQLTKVTLTIILEHLDNFSVPKTFATGDEVGGYVSMEMPELTEFDAVSINLEEPVGRSELRRIRTMDVGWFYQIPFRFEVPLDQRKPTKCQEDLRESVREAQLMLPPSYEKNSVPSTAPNIASISYCIKAKLLRNDTATPLGETPRMITLGETSRVIRIVPIVKEEPLLQNCSSLGKESIAAATAYLEGKAWTGSQGKMEMEVTQPKSLCVPVSIGYDTCQKESVGTRAEMRLRFEPIEVNGVPPKLTKITAHLRAATRVSSNSMSDCPYRIGNRADGTYDGLSIETIPLVGGTVQQVKWQRDLTGHNRDSMTSDKPGGRRYLTTVLPLHLVLPLKKQYLPTFHLSLISHFYVLILVLSFRMHGDAISTKKESMRLEVPIQVSSELFINRESHFSDDSDGEGN